MKYAQAEIERRWLVDTSALPDLSSCRHALITDSYLQATRLRLRKIENQADVQFKLCKKYGKAHPLTEDITNIYLTQSEYEQLLKSLPGAILRRKRIYFPYQGHHLAINFPENPKAPVIAECEFLSETEAEAFFPPTFCREEVSDKPEFEAWNFAQTEEGFAAFL
ncbi:hypothetical protein COW36_02515 [bacterium (Candidatus Blackallbacteria) CG17_big_fil_post_rev_8_21_14_2_50_48_46]|uniref:CYTH domain-containing protein n=1 Tax=bacterium (Candidatus Blackallbacteria) CG17_big_fil_post_rev_8_21_14_2_50_48_46 TaxID=2014261 RepID=A0A2M7GA33_9BACT|nr:MAG: hypothetical protein COW64_12955 [bacterium (Candidatus Blackallbacteria) CG18_big_fil_WC_8_21_14_2_50_49_26]PIW19001.1 MAG: hypothetical protein COW36_02515 [bacterium (Candidatus Blackallbacteria) CG17_big_fil_post_rev_8_21_14_2_50_48_46]PIW44631.1 MAG: hypothetical protein COW20_23600 [bacterium (Candidatus Blackallbacteria) CG13_big_fil_rev_8_21_14_2_50_49_14]